MKRLGITFVILSLIIFFGMAYAAEQKGEAEKAEKSVMGEKQALASAVKVSMAAALATASKQVAGTVLAAEVENEDGKTMYCFEIMPTPTSEIVKEVRIDAVTGAFIGTEDENVEKEATEKAAEMKESKKGEKSESCESEKGKEGKEKDNEKEGKGKKSEKDKKGSKNKKMKESKEKGEKEQENEKDENDEKD